MSNSLLRRGLLPCATLLACVVAAPYVGNAQLNGPEAVARATISGTLTVTGTQTIAQVGECSRVNITIAGSITGDVDDGGGVDQVGFELWDDGTMKDSGELDIPVGTTQPINVTLNFLGQYQTGAPGVGVLVYDLPSHTLLYVVDPFIPTDVAGVCPDCSASPRAGCTSAAKSILMLKNSDTDDGKDKLTWKWLNGTSEVLSGDLGDPTATTTYTLCVYAGSDLAGLSLPAGSTWKAAGTKGFKLKDATGTPDGVQKALLKSGAAGKSKVLVKGKGSNLPDDLSGVLPFPVTVQMVNDANSTCFESVFSSAIKNDGKLFKAQTP